MSIFRSLRKIVLASSFLMFGCPLFAQTSPQTPDMPGKFDAPVSSADYEKRNVMIPMRDGVKLFTVIVVPKGAHNAPILMTRTPYDASKRAERTNSPHMLATLPMG